jgi:hypothetical protein
MLEFGGEKMSKSLGNDVSLRNVIDTWGREVVLLFFMTAHWRKPIDFTDETLQQASAMAELRPGDLRAEAGSLRSGRRSRRRSTTTSTRLRRVAGLHEWRRASQLELLAVARHLRSASFPETRRMTCGARRERAEARARRLGAGDGSGGDGSLGWVVQDDGRLDTGSR